MGSNHIQLIDQYDRHLNYLRISVTDRCNLRCLYCIPPDGIAKLGHGDILTYEEILRLARIAVNLGVDKIRLTGGEPLVRKGIYEFIPRLTALPGLKEVSLTTNGIYLRDNLEKLRSAGIKRINVSLDTLHREKYEKITGYDGFQQVWEGIRLARKLKFQPIKINVVVIKGINDDEILDFARMTLDKPYHIRFIEYMPVGEHNSWSNEKFISTDEIKEKILEIGGLHPVLSNPFDGPAERFRLEGGKGEIGFIGALSNHFCESCNRLRLTSEGHLRGCLFSDSEIDVKGPLREGKADDYLIRLITRAIESKPKSPKGMSPEMRKCVRHMSSIGG